jgi:hypothetical protein
MLRLRKLANSSDWTCRGPSSSPLSGSQLVEEELAIQNVRWNGLPLTVILCRHLGWVRSAELQRICDAIVTALNETL